MERPPALVMQCITWFTPAILIMASVSTRVVLVCVKHSARLVNFCLQYTQYTKPTLTII